MNDFLRALGLLTILPVRLPADEAAAPGRAMAADPLVGAVIGALLAGLAGLLSQTRLADHAPLLPAGLVLATWAALTGALHLDGWGDCCDALFAPVSRERRLEIMKDPRLGEDEQRHGQPVGHMPGAPVLDRAGQQPERQRGRAKEGVTQ